MDIASKYKPELWGGMECTVNRVKNKFRDQFEHTGHYQREMDLAMIAGLGIRKLRYPVLWEVHQPTPEAKIDWSWSDRQLQTIREAGIDPIVGLLHHGSGPAFTQLDDEEFPEKFASYAALVAARYPWITYYTPVNEPLTTARFSGLYGLWYPHEANDRSFVKMLYNELKGTVMSMQEIRKINPQAQLVQTEDLAFVHSSPLLHYQATFENHRRWLTWDLLTGRVDKKHPLWKYLLKSGLTATQLHFFLENPCPPDLIGCNYYVTSERYLDVDIEKYSLHLHGTNGKHVYADTEAVRMGKCKGLRQLLMQTWQRYQLPIAVTECHLHCTREEQLRWLNQCMEDAQLAAKAGADVRAVTCWSLLGAFDWNSLLTREDGDYEPGVFDISGGKPRATALAKMMKQYSASQSFDHPLLSEPGWWETKTRSKKIKKPAPPVLLLGKNGTLATAFQKICEDRRIPIVALDREQISADAEQFEKLLRQTHAWALINATGYVRVDDAEDHPEECFEVNAHLPAFFARECQRHGLPMITFSSDLVFDGNKNCPYVESDRPASLNVYGASKFEGERLVRAACPGALIIRSSSFFGPWDQYNFAHAVSRALQTGETFRAASDIRISPTYVPDLVNRALDLLVDGENGTWHIVNEGEVTWFDFAMEIAQRENRKTKLILPTPAEKMGWKATRPAYSVLHSEKTLNLASMENALSRYFSERRA